MALTDIRTEVRDITRTDTTSFPNTALDRKINIVYKYLQAEIIQATGHKNDFLTFKRSNLVEADGLSEGDTGYNGEYPLPSDMIIPIRIELKYDEDQRPATVYDQSENTTSEWVEDDLDKYSELKPKIRFARNSIFVRPLPEAAVTNGIYLEYLSTQDALADDTDVPQFLALFRDVLTLGTAVRFFLGDAKKYSSELKEFREEYSMAKSKLIDFYQDRLPKNLRISSNKDYQTESFN